MDDLQTKRRPRYSGPFLGAYFFYYSGYCVFSSYIVLYLTEQGYSATLCGVITSITLLANLLMEPVGGYLTDTFLSTRRYLALCTAAILGLCVFCTRFAHRPELCLPALILTAGLAYPFSQLMDAWVNCSLELDPGLVYSRIRAGGSIGFALTSVLAGHYFRRFGWDTYFLVQAALFLMVLPFLALLPRIELGNRRREAARPGERQLSLAGSFRVAAGSRRYMLCLLLCTVYWLSHRPVGSYLSLISAARGGDAGTFGNVCAVGAAVEFLTLMALAAVPRGDRLPLRTFLTAALLTDVLRPLLVFALPGLWPLYLGQALQSVSFALYFAASVECFTRTADRRIRSFCISMGLTVSSVTGTILANLLGGWLCDRFGVDSLVLMSLLTSLANCGLLAACGPVLFSPDGPTAS
ncbi:MAG: MFS transporter [Oscillospiraceae bacterium]|nr:MFS transporter [Oscillospiraceae bacterium]